MKAYIFIRVFLFYIIIYTGESLINETDIKESKSGSQAICSISNVHVRLTDSVDMLGNDGIVEVLLPQNSYLQTVCYPRDIYEHQHAVTLAHAVCRQLGYMTYTSRYKQTFPIGQESPSLLATSLLCLGHEQLVSQCSIRTRESIMCRVVLGVQCDSCYKVMKAAEGLITSPGYPHAYLYTTFCEWDIIVAEGYNIHLIFQHLKFPRGQEMSLPCKGTEPYVEVQYGFKENYSIKKYCSSNQIMNLSIPHKEAKIKFFSGIHRNASLDKSKKYGFSLKFIAKADLTPSTQPIKLLIILSGLCMFFLAIISCYCCRRWNRFSLHHHVQGSRMVSNVPTREQIQLPPQLAFLQYREQTQHPNVKMDINKNTSQSQGSVENYYSAVKVPVQPVLHKESSHITPLTIISEDVQKKDHLTRLKTKLFSRFSTSAGSYVSTRSEFQPRPSVEKPTERSFQIYHSISSGSLSPNNSNLALNANASEPSPASVFESCDFKKPEKQVEPKGTNQGHVHFHIPAIVINYASDEDGQTKPPEYL